MQWRMADRSLEKRKTSIFWLLPVTGALKMREWKRREWKYLKEIAGVENARVE